MDQLKAMAPYRLTRPNVGRNPVTPQRVHGDTMEPKVSVPMENPTNPAEVADAEPAEDPLDPCSGSQGFRVFSSNQTSPQAIHGKDDKDFSGVDLFVAGNFIEGSGRFHTQDKIDVAKRRFRPLDGD